MFEISEDVTIRKKNQITIPLPVLKHLNVGIGNKIRFEVNDADDVVLYKTVSHKITKRKDNGGCRDNKTSQKGNMRDGGEKKNKAVANQKKGCETSENEKNKKTGSGGNSKRSSTSANLT